MMMKKLLIAGGALALALAAPTLASAQSQMIRGEGYYNPAGEAPPLIVRKRAFTDSGTAVPTGYENRSLETQTILNQPTYTSFSPDKFGADVLPRPFDGLGLN